MLEGYPVRLSVTEQLAASASGKHRWIICDMPAVTNPPPEVNTAS